MVFPMMIFLKAVFLREQPVEMFMEAVPQTINTDVLACADIQASALQIVTFARNLRMLTPVLGIVFDCAVAQNYIKNEEEQRYEKNAQIKRKNCGSVDQQPKELNGEFSRFVHQFLRV